MNRKSFIRNTLLSPCYFDDDKINQQLIILKKRGGGQTLMIHEDMYDQFSKMYQSQNQKP